MITRIHLRLPNAYKLMSFDRNINGNRNVKFYEWDYWSLHRWKNLTLELRLQSQTEFKLGTQPSEIELLRSEHIKKR